MLALFRPLSVLTNVARKAVRTLPLRCTFASAANRASIGQFFHGNIPAVFSFVPPGAAVLNGCSLSLSLLLVVLSL